MEAAFDYMETSRMAASESALPEQVAIANDAENPHWYLTIQPSAIDGKPTFIMGHVYSQDEFIALEGSYYDMDDPESREEWEWTYGNWVASRQRGIVFVRAYSVIEPDGEPGSTHIAAMAPATKEAFDEFLAAKCHVTTRLLQPHVFMVIDHIITMRARLKDR